jgi:hypothetical protein
MCNDTVTDKLVFVSREVFLAILGEMVNLQKVNMPKKVDLLKTPSKISLLVVRHFGYFMLRLNFWQVDFLEFDYFS